MALGSQQLGANKDTRRAQPESLRTVILQRRTLLILGILVVFNALLIFSSYTFGLKKPNPALFFEERHVVTFFSCLFLAGTALTAFIIGYLHRRIDGAHPVANFWWLSGVGTLAMSMDDWFQGHEGIDSAVLRLLGTPAHPYQFDGYVIALLGLIALAGSWYYRREVSRHPPLVFFLLLVGVCVAGTVGFDQVATGLGPHLDLVIEESFKVVGASLLFGGYLTVLLDFLKRILAASSASSSENDGTKCK